MERKENSKQEWKQDKGKNQENRMAKNIRTLKKVFKRKRGRGVREMKCYTGRVSLRMIRKSSVARRKKGKTRKRLKLKGNE